MNYWNVLILDDDAYKSDNPKSRRVQYKKLESYEHTGKRFALTFAENADDARRLLAAAGTDIVLLDVRLPGWGDDDSGELFGELFRLADKRYTVGLVSNQWNEDAMKIVRRFLVKNPEIAMPLFFTLRDFENDAFAVIASQIVAYVRRQRNQYELGLTPETSLRLLHISDLHFGSDTASRTLAGIGNITQLCDSIKQCWPARDGSPAGPDLVLITGDIGNTGHPKDYEDAMEWFQQFSTEFQWSLPTPRFLIVPGNHDFSVPLCSAHRIHLGQDNKPTLSDADGQAQEQLAAYAMLPFSEFVTRVCGIRHLRAGYPLGAWVEFGFSEYGVAFSGFNTSRCHSQASWPLRSIHRDDIAAVNKSFTEREVNTAASEILHIALSHHSLIRYSGAREEVSNDQECSEHLLGKSWSPQLLLHGHEHRRWGALPSGTDFLVVAAPTPTKNDSPTQGTTPRGLNLLELPRSRSVVSGIHARSLVKLEAGWQLLDLPGKPNWTRPHSEQSNLGN
jgi:predicted MPP superfamily phosphohydrolase